MRDHRRILVCMVTAALIPVSEYLATSYRPDRDYIDGELKERNVGETLHRSAQLYLGALFLAQEQAWQVFPTTEQRIQVSADHFRVADLCVRRLSDGAEPIVRRPPLLCVEILSPGDSLSGLQDVVDDYLAMGVEHVWVVDPLLDDLAAGRA